MPDRMGTYRVTVHYAKPGWSFVDVYDPVFSRPWINIENKKDWVRDFPSAVGFVLVITGFAIVSLIILYDDSRIKLL